MVPGEYLVPPSTKLTANLCAVPLVRKRRGRSPGDCLFHVSGFRVDVNNDQESENIQSGGGSDQNISETGLRDTGTPSIDILWNINENASCANFIEQSQKLNWEVFLNRTNCN